MAMRIAALTGGAAAVGVALAATDARAEDGPPAAQAASEEKREDVGPVQALRVEGLGRFSCMSRGPAAPPLPPADFDTLLARISQVPS